MGCAIVSSRLDETQSQAHLEEIGLERETVDRAGGQSGGDGGIVRLELVQRPCGVGLVGAVDAIDVEAADEVTLDDVADRLDEEPRVALPSFELRVEGHLQTRSAPVRASLGCTRTLKRSKSSTLEKMTDMALAERTGAMAALKSVASR